MKIQKSTIDSLVTCFLNEAKYYLKDALLSIYLYGSVLTADFTPTSDVDFVVLLRYLPKDVLVKVRSLHDAVCLQHSFGFKLEGGYHTVHNGSAAGNRRGVWVENSLKIELCDLELEPDSVESIIEKGRLIYGDTLESYIQKPDKMALARFSEKYLLDFSAKLPERTTSNKHFFSSILNACRSICYLESGSFPSKAVAATCISNTYPAHKQIVEKAISFRNGNMDIMFTKEDIYDAIAFIDCVVPLITNKEG